MKVSGCSDVGMLRSENQDAFAAVPLAKENTMLAIVCDGIGGEAGGKDAADICVRVFDERHKGKPLPTKDELYRTLEEANKTVLSVAAEKGYARMATTAVAARVTEEEVLILWAGDSRAYLWHDGALRRCTKDHSYVQALIEEGRLTEEEAVTHPYRNLITRAVGAEETLLGDSVSLSWQTGDRLLLCTDGLTAMMGEKEICEILSENMSLGVAVHELISAANYHGGEDNITVIVLENTKESTFDA
jgi:protein phosphatase